MLAPEKDGSTLMQCWDRGYIKVLTVATHGRCYLPPRQTWLAHLIMYRTLQLTIAATCMPQFEMPDQQREGCNVPPMAEIHGHKCWGQRLSIQPPAFNLQQ